MKNNYFTTCKKACDWKIGEQFTEGRFSAGKIVAKRDCPNDPTIVWFLLCSENKEYTIYSAEKKILCQPTVGRNIPIEIVEYFFMFPFMQVEIPCDNGLCDEKHPVSKKHIKDVSSSKKKTRAKRKKDS